MKTARQIRAEFLQFFREQGHVIVPSAPVVAHGDPTLMFINAGMNQFKDVFLETGSRDYSRCADSQKCIRVSGKHNDLEEVGVDTYHHTFFEMLGNWSFGDYFKQEAIEWAWELLVNRWGLDPDRVYVTVFGGDEADGLQVDEEAERLWTGLTPINPDNVLRFGKKDNFWEMGETGPCGPCTEIHYDRGPEADDTDGSNSWVNTDSARYIELWNLVFIQYNRGEDGVLSPLPKKHIDTGMGFERIVAVLQNKNSNYDTDLFTPIFERIEEVTGKIYGGSDNAADVAFRVIADHVRTLSVAFADGALPGNDGRGYVLRRILRRAARFGRQSLGQTAPFIHKLPSAVADVLGEAFPEVAQRTDHIELLIESEEKAFAQTLDRGLALYEKLSEGLKDSGGKVIDGGEAFDLYATFGFPRDLVELMAREDGLTVDSSGWDSSEEAHKEASRSSAFGHAVDPSEFEGLPATESLVYEGALNASAAVLKCVGGEHLVLDRTPFYPEGGGQVGDCGSICGDGFRFDVTGTARQGDVIVHSGIISEGDVSNLPDNVSAEVDASHRRSVCANHTATHLLQSALREVLGDHVAQQGSLVAPDRLRFDFTHPEGVSPADLIRVEQIVSQQVARNAQLQTTVENLDDARARGVTALFGEKYDSDVRVVAIGDASLELCGGTHCDRTGDVGAFCIVSESAVQAGVRRIEAVTGFDALESFQQARQTLREAAALMKTKPQDPPARVDALQAQVRELRKSGSQKSASDAASVARGLLDDALDVAGTKVVVKEMDAPASELSAIADVLRGKETPVCGLLATRAGGKVAFVTFAQKGLAPEPVHAGNVAREIAGMLGGGGGGRPEFAQAGGKNPDALPDALERAVGILTSALKK